MFKKTINLIQVDWLILYYGQDNNTYTIDQSG